MGKRSEAGRAGRGEEPSSPPPLPPGRPWPAWACALASAPLLFHILAMLAGELAGQVNTSPLEAELGRRFRGYNVLIQQVYAHAYFAPEPDPATAVVTARLQFGEGKPPREVRIPDRSARPRIRYLRQLALAWHLVHEWSGPDVAKRPRWAASYARHLCRAHPGCTGVELFARVHRSPDPGEVVDAAARGERVDLDTEDLYEPPVSIGAFSCDDF